MKMKFGAIVVAGSGKIGGHVASKNRGGAYLRTKTTPSNPNTAAQAAARGILSSLSQGWSSLTDSQRAGWNAAVSDFSSTDIFGDIKNPTGLNLYIKLNTNLINTGQAQLTNAPAKMEILFSPLDRAQYDISDNILEVVLSDAAMDGAVVLISATPPLPAGVSYAKNKFRVIGYGTVAGGIVESNGLYTDKFGALVTTDNVQVSYKVIAANGQASPAFITKLEINA